MAAAVWRVAGASVTGTSHHGKQTPCQDSHAIAVDGTRLIVAVSDGMGSAAYSHVSSRLLVDTVVRSLRVEPRPQRRLIARLGAYVKRFVAPESVESRLRAAAAEGRAAIQRLAARRRHALRDYACTLIVVVIDADGWHVLHIGDGAAVGFRSDRDMATLSRPYNGEYANSTSPITASDWQRHIRCNHGSERLSGVAVFSDGIQNLCINHQTGKAYPGFFQPIAEWFRSLPADADVDTLCGQFLARPTITDKSDDDLTLCYAWREL
jgi:hypothetical protein